MLQLLLMKRKIFISMFSLCLASAAMAQDCKVLMEPLAGTYQGDCKSGKASGKGKAVGQDTYEGDFKSGYPEGKGMYTWKNKDWYEGSWKNGQRDGEGTMHITNGGTGDSAIVGFWKKDKYSGRYEKPYKVLSQTQGVNNVTVNKMQGSDINEITIILSSVSGGVNTLTSQSKTGTPNPKIKLTSIDPTKGTYQSLSEIEYQPKATKFILRQVQYPFTAHFRSDTENFEIAFYDAGNWTVDVKILQ